LGHDPRVHGSCGAAVILTDVDLSKGYHRDLLDVGASRATDRLVVLERRSSPQ
jgi:hypothetical protein